MMRNTVYLDHAATSFPKPRAVMEAINRCMTDAGGNPGRGSHRLALLAAEEVYACRETAAAFFGADNPERVVFTLNTTYALNIAIKSVLKPGDHVLISDREHNAVFRPVEACRQKYGIRYDLFTTKGDGEAVLTDIRQKLRPNTKAVIATHVSNVANAALPLAKIGALCRERGIVWIVDAAQSAGHLPLNVREMQIDMLCVPGHKGLYGPQGCGVIVYGSENFLPGETLVEGGSGIHSLERGMPMELPERFEAGTLPTPALAGLRAGIEFVKETGIIRIHEAETALWRLAYERLSGMRSVCLYDRTPGAVLLFNVTGADPSEVGAYLNDKGICVRTGYHCAPLAHETLRTLPGGGVRASFGYGNTEADIRRFTDAVYGFIRKSR